MNVIITHLIIIISCIIPAMVANATPVLVRKLPLLGYPIRKNGLGVNKTRRGLIFGTIAGTIIGYIFLSYMQELIIGSGILHFYAHDFSPLLMSFLLSFGALMGDIGKSYWKRRYNIMPGKPFVPRDQIDYIIGTFLFTCRWIDRSYVDFLSLCIIGGLISYTAHYFGYLLGLIDTKQ